MRPFRSRRIDWYERTVRALGRYELVTRIASGHSSEVHLAHLSNVFLYSNDRVSDQAIAVKIIKPELARLVGYRAILTRESNAATTFEHPNALKIFDIGATNPDEVYIAMEFAFGQPLSSVLQRASLERRQLSREMFLWIALEAGKALRLAHRTPWAEGEQSPILHGSLSPQSIMLTYDGDVRVLGIGVGRSHMCLPPAITTLAYRAPELIERTGTDRRADIYSLGVLLYDAISGQRVFKRRSVEETQEAVLAHTMAPIDELCPDVDGDLVQLICAMTAPKRGDRPKSLSEVEEVLVQHVSGDQAAMSSQLRALTTQMFANELRAQRRMVEAMLRPSGQTAAPVPMAPIAPTTPIIAGTPLSPGAPTLPPIPPPAPAVTLPPVPTPTQLARITTASMPALTRPKDELELPELPGLPDAPETISTGDTGDPGELPDAGVTPALEDWSVREGEAGDELGFSIEEPVEAEELEPPAKPLSVSNVPRRRNNTGEDRFPELASLRSQSSSTPIEERVSAPITDPHESADIPLDLEPRRVKSRAVSNDELAAVRPGQALIELDPGEEDGQLELVTGREALQIGSDDDEVAVAPVRMPDGEGIDLAGEEEEGDMSVVPAFDFLDHASRSNMPADEISEEVSIDDPEPELELDPDPTDALPGGDSEREAWTGENLASAEFETKAGAELDELESSQDLPHIGYDAAMDLIDDVLRMTTGEIRIDELGPGPLPPVPAPSPPVRLKPETPIVPAPIAAPPPPAIPQRPPPMPRPTSSPLAPAMPPPAGGPAAPPVDISRIALDLFKSLAGDTGEAAFNDPIHPAKDK